MKRPYSERKFVIIGIFITIGMIFLVKIFYLQVIDDSYLVSANRNTLRYITQYPARGLIYDRNDKLIVYNEATYDLMVVPKEVKNLDTAEICSLLGITVKELVEKLIKATLPVSKHAELTLDKFSESNQSSSHHSGRSFGRQSNHGQPRNGQSGHGQAKKPYKYPKPKFYR